LQVVRNASGMIRTRPADALRRSRLGGTDGNERLTHAVAVALTIVLAAEGLTLLRFRQLISVHMFVGMVLIPVVAMKLASIGWRFARYYLHTPAYVEKGPPLLPLRVLAPALVLTTVLILVTGVWLMLLGHHSDALLTVHKISFIVWSALFAVHFLSYAPRVLRSLGAGDRVPGEGLRASLVAVALVVGIGLAIVVLPTIDAFNPRHHHDHDREANAALRRS
jgi:hypothetical protein